MKIDATAIHRIIASKVLDLWGIYHFGSSAADTQTAESDIDLAFVASTRVAPETLFDLRQELEVVLARDVDLVDLRAAPDTLVAEILEAGPAIWTTNAIKLAEYETQRMSQYCQLNEERRGILHDIVKRGSVYGR